MTDLVNPRDVKPHTPDSELSDPVAAGVKLIKGAMYGLDASGNAVKLTSGVGTLIARGEVLYTVDNTDGSAGDVKVRGRAGSFELHILGGDPVTRSAIGDVVYAYDDHTIAATSNTGARPKAGTLMNITPAGNAVVKVGPTGELDGDLVAANNLSDVVTPATARSNIGANKIMLSFEGISSKAADAEVVRWVAPFACTLVNFYTALNAALATADATVQAKVQGTNAGSTTTGLATVTQSGSAAGDVDSATPLTTNLALTAGQVLSFTVGGGSTATGTLNLSALLTY